MEGEIHPLSKWRRLFFWGSYKCTALVRMLTQVAADFQIWGDGRLHVVIKSECSIEEVTWNVC